jgi:hypothetical protein
VAAAVMSRSVRALQMQTYMAAQAPTIGRGRLAALRQIRNHAVT